ncbi:glycosyltransferase family 39 protein [Candidatus Gottesmanbacteria bacterium]|nr:glycosyltransferase family 39 protein [Candidatus Gottesmanbacteria bacterium]
MRKLLNWLDDNLISILAAVLLVFIPLYPKKPLFDILPGYIVRIRVEDFLVAITSVLWLIWIIRGKINFKRNLVALFIGIYLLVGLLSMLSAIFVTQTVPLSMIHVGKMALHFFRRIEYFSLFFIFYTTIKSLKQVKTYLILLIATMVAVTLYGYGQKYLYWPAFSTMNREFSKGWALYLTPHSRVLSTFGGHYDLAAFTMMLLVILWATFFSIKKWLLKIGVLIVLGGAFWLLILTASRTSFLAYLLGITVLCFFYAFKKGLRWSFISWISIMFLSISIMLSFGDLSERFTKLLKLDERLSGIKSLVLNPFGKPPGDQAIFLANNPVEISQVTSRSDQPPSPLKPVDVEKDMPLLIPDAKTGTISAVARTYSQAALLYDLSTGIRLDALWPRAIKGFTTNPLLGTGYSTLTKVNVEDFTEAESTDNDFLRSLGETGLLGFLSFYGILVSMVILIWRTFIGVKDPLFFGILTGFVGVIVALLANAVYIDVFEASKVAFSFWAIAGIAIGGLKVAEKNIAKESASPHIKDWQEVKNSLFTSVKRFFRSDLFLLIIIIIIAFITRIYKIDSPVADWHSWRQADTASVTRNFVNNGINLLYPTYHDLSSIPSGLDNPKGYRMVEFPLYNYFSVLLDKLYIGQNPEYKGRLTTIFISLVSLIFIFKLVKKYSGSSTALLAALFFAIIPYNIFYSRVILPEPLLVMLSFGLLYFFDKWLETNRLRYFILSFIFGAFALLLKPYAVFILPAIFYLSFRKWRFRLFFRPSLYLLAIGIIAPFIFWRLWISQFPEGIPAYTWLLNGDGIRFKGAFFHWIFAERIGKLILGFWGLPLLILGLLAKPKKEGLFFYFIGLGSLLFLIVFATGNVRHDYYQIFIIPAIAIFIAKGVIFIWEKRRETASTFLAIPLIFISIIFMVAFGWYQIRDFYNINHPEIVEAGQEVDRIAHPKALVIAPYNGDTAFLFQTKRSGWPIVDGSIDTLIEKGADYYVSVNYDDLTKDLLREALREDQEKKPYKTIQYNTKYAIIQLVLDRDLPK